MILLLFIGLILEKLGFLFLKFNIFWLVILLFLKIGDCFCKILFMEDIVLYFVSFNSIEYYDIGVLNFFNIR